MTVLESVKDFIGQYPGIQPGDSETEVGLFVDHLKADVPSYSIDTIPAAKIIETYIDDSSLRQYVFALRVHFSTLDEVERLQNNGFFEDFSEWLETQTESGNLPILDGGKVAQKIEARDAGVLFDEESSDTGAYQIQCVLEYKQPPIAQEQESE
jgi:hypothetical protein